MADIIVIVVIVLLLAIAGAVASYIAYGRGRETGVHAERIGEPLCDIEARHLIDRYGRQKRQIDIAAGMTLAPGLTAKEIDQLEAGQALRHLGQQRHEALNELGIRRA